MITQCLKALWVFWAKDKCASEPCWVLRSKTSTHIAKVCVGRPYFHTFKLHRWLIFHLRISLCACNNLSYWFLSQQHVQPHAKNINKGLLEGICPWNAIQSNNAKCKVSLSVCNPTTTFFFPAFNISKLCLPQLQPQSWLLLQCSLPPASLRHLGFSIHASVGEALCIQALKSQLCSTSSLSPVIWRKTPTLNPFLPA